jgi:ABC-type siderophore export system fused ATPase/permease subunit
MLRKNLPGAVFVCLILFSFVGVGFYLGITMDWSRFFKYLAVVAVIAFIVSAIINTVPSAGNDKH